MSVDTIESLKSHRNGQQARPNVYRRSQEARDTTDAFLRATAGFDTDRPRIPWWRRLKVWELWLLVLGAIGLLVAAWVGR